MLGGCSGPSWQEVNSSDGEYSIEFPGTPQTRKDSLTLMSGETTDLHIQSVSVGGNLFLASYCDLPDRERLPMADWMKSVATAAYEGRVLAKESIKVNGFCGNEFESEFEDPIEGSLIGQVVLVRTEKVYRLYRLQVVGENVTSRDPEVRRFLDSLELKVTGKQIDGPIVAELDKKDGQKNNPVKETITIVATKIEVPDNKPPNINPSNNKPPNNNPNGDPKIKIADGLKVCEIAEASFFGMLPQMLWNEKADGFYVADNSKHTVELYSLSELKAKHTYTSGTWNCKHMALSK